MDNPVIPFYAGTSGLVLPVPNKLFFPEAFKNKSRLTYFGSLFNSIEINSSFYKVPMPSTVARWASSVPDDFKFTFKLFKEITHQKELFFDRSKLSKFLDAIAPADAKKGCLLIQLPPSIKIGHLKQFETLLNGIKENDSSEGWNLAVEFRDPSWYIQSVYDLLKSFGTTLVFHDMPKSLTAPMEPITDIVYLRFHGSMGDYRGDYNHETLDAWSSSLFSWLKQGKSVYVYFNNTLGEAVKNLTDLIGQVHLKFESALYG